MKIYLRVLALVASVLIASSNGFAANYKIDADHSSVGFKVRHLAISSVSGSFSDFSGTFSYDPANVKASKTEASISTTSISTLQTKRDDHLRSPDFFDAPKFPVMKFVSKDVLNATPTGFQLLGDLTIRDVTKPVTLDVKFLGTTKDPFGNDRAVFEASSVINRKDFGLTWSKVLETGALVVGEEVTISLQVEGIKTV